MVAAVRAIGAGIGVIVPTTCEFRSAPFSAPFFEAAERKIEMQTGNRVRSRAQCLKATVSLIFLITSLSTDRAQSAYVTSVCVGNMDQRFRGPFAPRATRCGSHGVAPAYTHVCGTTNERLISLYCRLGGEVRKDADYPGGQCGYSYLSVICYQQSDIAPPQTTINPLPPPGSGGRTGFGGPPNARQGCGRDATGRPIVGARVSCD